MRRAFRTTLPAFSCALSYALSFALLLASSIPARADGGAPPPNATSTLTVTGGVQHPLSLDIDALRAHARIVELQVPGKNGGKPGTVRGVRLRDLLDEARIATSDHNTVKKLAIIASAPDGYKVVFSWSELFNSPLGDGVLVLFERDGQPLPKGEGPLALFSAKDSNTGPRHVKFLQAIEVRQVVD